MLQLRPSLMGETRCRQGLQNPSRTVRVRSPPPSLALPSNYSIAKASGQMGPTGGARPKLRDDEFTGLTYKDAAKSYLQRVGHAVSMGCAKGILPSPDYINNPESLGFTVRCDGLQQGRKPLRYPQRWRLEMSRDASGCRECMDDFARDHRPSRRN